MLFSCSNLSGGGADVTMPNWNEIRKEWETTKITLKNLAAKHEVKLGTLKSRKSREKWSRVTKKDATKTDKVATPKKMNETEKKERYEPIVEGDDLTDKQRLFCIYYLKSFNATQAAIKAGYSPDTAHVQGSRLLSNAKVASEIRRLKGEMQQGIFVDAMDVLNKYIKIAFADITDYVEFGSKEVPNDEFKEELTGVDQSYTYSYVNFKESGEVDGTIVTEVKKGKDGISVKLADKMKALDMLTKYFDLLSENNQKRLKEEKMKMDIKKAKAEVDQLSDSQDDGPVEIVITRKGDSS